MRIQKKPFVLDAWVLPEPNVHVSDTPNWVLEAMENKTFCVAYGTSYDVHTIEGIMTGYKGDVLVKGIEGELYIIAKRIFDITYDIVEV